MPERMRDLVVKLNGRKVASLRIRLPDGDTKLDLASWTSLEDRLSSRAMSLPPVRRLLERKGVARTVYHMDGVYEIWTAEHAQRVPARGRRPGAIKPVPKGYRRLTKSVRP